MDKNDFNIYFTRASCSFFGYVLRKFKDQLPYDGQYKRWETLNGYGNRMFTVWNQKGHVHPRAVNALHKDLCILRQKDPTIPSIQELFEEFRNLK